MISKTLGDAMTISTSLILMSLACHAPQMVNRPLPPVVSVQAFVHTDGQVCLVVQNGTSASLFYDQQDNRHGRSNLERRVLWSLWVGVRYATLQQWWRDLFLLRTLAIIAPAPIRPQTTRSHLLPHPTDTFSAGRYRVCFRFWLRHDQQEWQERCSVPFRLPPSSLEVLDPQDHDADPPSLPAWKDLNEETWGPAARTEEYLPHKACDMCFTLPNYSPYTVNEYVESDVEDGAIIIMREIPNPAPEIMARADYDPEIGGYYDPDTGARVWFVGTDAFTGPTDEEKWSSHLPVSTIEMKRIKARHLDRIFSIEGVNSFGIGAHGFVVGVSPHTPESHAVVPKDLEGIPVEVRIQGLAVLNSHDDDEPPALDAFPHEHTE